MIEEVVSVELPVHERLVVRKNRLTNEENGIDMPICEEVYQILYNGKLPSDCAQDLMIRDLKKEF